MAFHYTKPSSIAMLRLTLAAEYGCGNKETTEAICACFGPLRPCVEYVIAVVLCTCDLGKCSAGIRFESYSLLICSSWASEFVPFTTATTVIGKSLTSVCSQLHCSLSASRYAMQPKSQTTFSCRYLLKQPSSAASNQVPNGLSNDSLPASPAVPAVCILELLMRSERPTSQQLDLWTLLFKCDASSGSTAQHDTAWHAVVQTIRSNTSTLHLFEIQPEQAFFSRFDSYL